MEHNSEHCRSHCPINFMLETFGDKWTLLVVRDLMFKGKQYYGDFLKSDEKIATNILADRLKRLEQHGIVRKTKDPDNRTKVIYGLTAKGKDLMPILLEVTLWSAKYDTLTNTPKPFTAQYEKDKAAMVAYFQAALD